MDLAMEAFFSGVVLARRSGMVVPGLVVCGAVMNASKYWGLMREPMSARRGDFLDWVVSEGSLLWQAVQLSSSMRMWPWSSSEILVEWRLGMMGWA